MKRIFLLCVILISTDLVFAQDHEVVKGKVKSVDSKLLWTMLEKEAWTISRFEYDSFGKILMIKSSETYYKAAPSITLFSYNSKGWEIMQRIYDSDTLPTQLKATMEHVFRNDSLYYWKISSSSNKDVKIEYYEYDDRGNLLTKPYIEWLPGYFEYDSLNRVVKADGYEDGKSFLYRDGLLFKSIVAYGDHYVTTYFENGLPSSFESYLDGVSFDMKQGVPSESGSVPYQAWDFRYEYDEYGNWTHQYFKDRKSGKEKLSGIRVFEYWQEKQ
jgi:hypothetical protein